MTSPTESTTLGFDSIDTVPEFARLTAALGGEDWDAAEAELRALPPDEAAYAMSLIGEIDGIERFLEEAIRVAPRSACARATLAVRDIAIGWQIRTGARAENVSREQFEGFRAWLVAAERLLIDACALEESFAPAWGVRVLTARALQVGPSEAWRRFERLRALSPDDLPAQTHMLEYLLPKWAGSDEQARSFAHDTAAAAPPGSHSGALVAVYHVERWLELDGDEPGRQYMTQPQVIQELRDAAARSVLHEDSRPGPLSVQAHSAFAMAFWLARREEEAAVHFRAIGDRITEFPWSFAFDEASGVEAVRARILAEQGDGHE